MFGKCLIQRNVLISMKYTLTVCIPAYNEAQNIGRILHAVLNQEPIGYELTRVIVYSDASVDATAAIARAIGDKRVEVVEGAVRSGKAAGINHMFSMAQTDAVVLLDADSIVPSNQVLSKLVRCMHEHDASLVSGSCKPLSPRSFLQRLLVLGVEAWQELISRTPNSDMYRCGGQLVLMRKDLYAHISYPKTSADDVYPYIVAKERGLNYAYDVTAQIYYKLPSTYRDFFRQQTRFLNADASMETIFGKDVVQKYYTIRLTDKLKGIARAFLGHPILAVCYALMLISPKLLVALFKHDTGGLWAIAESTKDI